MRIESIQDLKQIDDLVNHIVEVGSIEIVLSNLNKDLREMGDILARIIKIQTLEVKNLFLDLTLNEIEVNTIKILVDGLEKCTSLQKLNINLWNNKLKTDGTSVLLRSLSKLTNLKSLQLTLSSNYIDDEIDLSSLVYLNDLEHLHLDFGVNRLTNNFFSLVLDPISKLTDLKSLTLNLESNRFISSQPLKLLPLKLGGLKNLDMLELNLAGMSIRNEGLFYVANLVTSLSLKVFNLLIWNSEIKDKAFIDFAKDFHPTELKKLKIIIWGNSLT